jgi:hypothetical protein
MSMQGDRGQAIQIGALILFAFLVTALALNQALVVPQNNAEVESRHFSEVQDDFSELRSKSIGAARTGTSRAVSIDLGVRYPPRSLTVNPPPVSGSLRTTNEGVIEFTGDPPITANEACTEASTDDSKASNARTRSLVYRPQYNEYNAPNRIAFENTVVAREFESGARYSAQNLVVNDSDATEINLVLLPDGVSRTQTASSTMVLKPSRQATNKTDASDSFTLVVPSTVEPAVWRNELLADQMVGAGGPIRSISDNTSTSTERIDIEFAQGAYEVSCAALGAGDAPSITPPDTSSSSATGAGVALNWGTGGVSDYSSKNNTQTLSLPNGKWTGIEASNEIILSNADYITNPNDRQKKLVETEFLMQNDTAEYVIRVKVSKDSDGQWQAKKVTVGTRSNCCQSAVLRNAAAEAIFNESTYTGTDILDIRNYGSQKSYRGSFGKNLAAVARMDRSEITITTSEVDGRVNYTLRRESLFTTINPDTGSSDNENEYVGLDFESPTDTDGWTMRDAAGGEVIMPDATLQGEVYFAEDETAFETDRNLDDETVHGLGGIDLGTKTDSLEIEDAQGDLRDEVAYYPNDTYDSPRVPDDEASTSRNWARWYNSTDDEVIVRELSGTRYVDNDTRIDWTTRSTANFSSAGLDQFAAAFVLSNNGKNVTTIDESGDLFKYDREPSGVKSLGPHADVDSDGQNEIVYLDDNQHLLYANPTGTNATLDSSGSVKEEGPIAVGPDQDGDGYPAIYYGRQANNGDRLYRVDYDGAPEKVTNASGDEVKAKGAIGVADFDGDSNGLAGAGAKDLIYVVNQSFVGHVDGDPDDDMVRRLGDQLTAKDAVGAPIKLSGTTEVNGSNVQIPYVNGSSYLKLYATESGKRTIVHNPNNGNRKASAAPIAVRIDHTNADRWDGPEGNDDDAIELVLVDGNNQRPYEVEFELDPTDADPVSSVDFELVKDTKVKKAGAG